VKIVANILEGCDGIARLQDIIPQDKWGTIKAQMGVKGGPLTPCQIPVMERPQTKYRDPTKHARSALTAAWVNIEDSF
jgi:hypothetical protein